MEDKLSIDSCLLTRWGLPSLVPRHTSVPDK